MASQTVGIGILLAMIILSGCAQQPGEASIGGPAGTISKTGTIKFDGVEYKNTAEALAAFRAKFEGQVLALKPEAEPPLRGKALIIVPDKDRMRPLVSAQILALFKRPVTGAALDYMIEAERISLRALADSLVHSHLFENSSVVEQNEADNPNIGDADYLVWYRVHPMVPGSNTGWTGSWQVRRAGSLASLGAGIDPGVAEGTPRLVSFVKSVRFATARLGGSVSTMASSSAQLPGDKTTRTLSSGSGIVIDPQGYVLTNNHVVQICPQPRIVDEESETFPATVAARDATNDLAVLRVAHRWPAAAMLSDSRDLRQGDSIVVTGYPLSGLVGAGMSLTTGTVTALSGVRGDSRLVQIAAPVQPGNSGGPLLDSGGNVVGVVTSTLNGMVLAATTGAIPQNVNFAIKTAVVRNFLDTYHVAYATAPVRHELHVPDIGDSARKFTVQVECRQ